MKLLKYIPVVFSCPNDIINKDRDTNVLQGGNKLNKKLKIFLGIILVLIVIAGGIFFGGKFYVKGKLSKIKKVEIPKAPAEIGIDTTKYKPDETVVKKGDSITNILLLGIDSRDPSSDSGRSDSIMILTIDEKNDKLKITSIMRDSLVNIDGHGQEKITHAHAYGGPLLTLKTVNQNYNMNIMNYVQVDFFSLAKVIDYIGGVDINVTADEVPLVNGYGIEVANIEKKKVVPISGPGLQHLSGSQAVAYSRIRHVGRDDFQRTERQRTVLAVLFKELSTRKVTDIPGVVDQIIPCVETSLKTDDIMNFAEYILTHKMTNFDQTRLPYDDLYKDAMVNKMSVLTWDKQATIDRLHTFIFGSKDK